MKINIPIELPDDFIEKLVERLVERGDCVLVTRCKDCKHFEGGKDSNCPFHRIVDRTAVYIGQEDFFCAFGERKEE